MGQQATACAVALRRLPDAGPMSSPAPMHYKNTEATEVASLVVLLNVRVRYTVALATNRLRPATA